MRRLSAAFLRCERGAVALEYAFIAALVSLAAILAFEALGVSVFSIFGLISSGLADSAGASAGS